MLTINNHSRDSAGLTYIYPVMSRRSGGLSVGVNLNPNNACNWRCVYCQVPGLVRGAAPEIDMDKLEGELRTFLDDVLRGDFFSRFDVPPQQRRIRDIAISGNGEPTSSRQFDRVVELIGSQQKEFGLSGSDTSTPSPSPAGEGPATPCRSGVGERSVPVASADGREPLRGKNAPELPGASERVKLVLITNGSLVRREIVQKGLGRLGELGGEVWFKLDSATEAGIRRINNVRLTPESVLRNLETAARLCPTWLQTCLFAFDGQAPSAEERKAYLDFLSQVRKRDIPLSGVLLYGLARPPMQEEAGRLSPLSAQWMEAFADEVRALGYPTILAL